MQELILGFGDEARRLRSSESSDSLARMAPTYSLKCLCCRGAHQSIHSLNPFPSFNEHALVFNDFGFVASPSQQSTLRMGVRRSGRPIEIMRATFRGRGAQDGSTENTFLDDNFSE